MAFVLLVLANLQTQLLVQQCVIEIFSCLVHAYGCLSSTPVFASGHGEVLRTVWGHWLQEGEFGEIG
jgi:hypothetical protein